MAATNSRSRGEILRRFCTPNPKFKKSSLTSCRGCLLKILFALFHVRLNSLGPENAKKSDLQVVPPPRRRVG